MLRKLALALVVSGLASSTPSAQTRRVVQPLLGAGQNTSAAPTVEDFFNDNVLHDIRLEINSKDWQTLKDNFLSNEYYPCDFRWSGQTVRNVGIRSRGNSSRSDFKPGLRVDFDRYSTNHQFLGLKSFVLRNNITDKSNMHERLSMLLFAKMGLKPPREAHARLYINGTYAGLYTLVESPDKNYLARIYGENDGYLYQFDRQVGDAPYLFEYRGDDPTLYVPHPFKPETHDNNPHPEEIAELTRRVNEAEHDEVNEYIDIRAFLRYVAVEMFLAEADGFLGEFGMNNFYLYRAPAQHRHAVIPWDKSETIASAERSVFRNVTDVPSSFQNRLMRRAMELPIYRDIYVAALLECAKLAAETIPGDTRGWMEREVEREYVQIREAAFADPAFSDADFEAAVNAFRAFARGRSAFVTAEVNANR
jgi:spore coat protein CotH